MVSGAKTQDPESIILVPCVLSLTTVQMLTSDTGAASLVCSGRQSGESLAWTSGGHCVCTLEHIQVDVKGTESIIVHGCFGLGNPADSVQSLEEACLLSFEGC